MGFHQTNFLTTGQRADTRRVREFRYAECRETVTIAVLRIDEITLLDTRYFGKVYIGDSKAIEVAGPANALRAHVINSKHHVGQTAFPRGERCATYFIKQELLEHAVIMVSKIKVVEFLVIGNSFSDPNDCEVVWRRHGVKKPVTLLRDEIPF